MTTTNINDRLEEIIEKTFIGLNPSCNYFGSNYCRLDEKLTRQSIRTACQEYAAEQNQQLRADAEALAVAFESEVKHSRLMAGIISSGCLISSLEALRDYRSRYPKEKKKLL
jgi:hypothetical protein